MFDLLKFSDFCTVSLCLYEFDSNTFQTGWDRGKTDRQIPEQKKKFF